VQAKQLEIGGNCFVHRPESSFSGVVVDLREGWAHVIGKGGIEDTHFNEWFPITSPSLSVEPA